MMPIAYIGIKIREFVIRSTMNDLNSKGAFIREVAKRAGFTIGDVQIILDAIVEVFMDAVRERKRIFIRGFGILYFQKLPARRNGLPQLKVDRLPETERVIFRLSETIRNVLKEQKGA